MTASLVLELSAVALSVTALLLSGIALYRTRTPKRSTRVCGGRYRIASKHPETGADLPDVFPAAGDDPDDGNAAKAAWRAIKAGTEPGDFFLLDTRCRTPRGRITRTH